MHDFVDVEPTNHARRVFRRYFFGTTLFCGAVFAFWTLDERQVRDAWYSRPDLKPFKAMVPKQDLDITERTMYEAHYQSYRNQRYKDEKKNRSWYRLFFPLNADYSVNRNPYAQTHRENVYNPANNYYANVGNVHYRHHLNE